MCKRVTGLSTSWISFLANVVMKWEKKVDELSELNMKVSKVRIGIVLSVDGGFLEKQYYLII